MIISYNVLSLFLFFLIISFHSHKLIKFKSLSFELESDLFCYIQIALLKEQVELILSPTCLLVSGWSEDRTGFGVTR